MEALGDQYFKFKHRIFQSKTLGPVAFELMFLLFN